LKAVASVQPTFSPSHAPNYIAPTFAPTKDNLVAFAADQIISGISLSEYQSTASYEEALVDTIASVMTGVYPADIYRLYATAVTANVRGAVKVSSVRALTASEIYVTYTVSAHVDGATYTSLSTQLVDSTIGGVYALFNVNMKIYGETYGAPVFAAGEATSDVASTNYITQPSSSGSADDDDAQLSAGAIAGIVIGVIAFIVIVAVVLFYVAGSAFGGGNSAKDNATPSATSSNYGKSAPAVQANPVFGISAISNSKTSATPIDDQNM